MYLSIQVLCTYKSIYSGHIYLSKYSSRMYVCMYVSIYLSIYSGHIYLSFQRATTDVNSATLISMAKRATALIAQIQARSLPETNVCFRAERHSICKMVSVRVRQSVYDI